MNSNRKVWLSFWPNLESAFLSFFNEDFWITLQNITEVVIGVHCVYFSQKYVNIVTAKVTQYNPLIPVKRNMHDFMYVPLCDNSYRCWVLRVLNETEWNKEIIILRFQISNHDALEKTTISLDEDTEWTENFKVSSVIWKVFISIIHNSHICYEICQYDGCAK